MVEIETHLFFQAVGIAVFTACLSEVINWVMVYRHADYQEIVAKGEALKASKAETEAAIAAINDEKKSKKESNKLISIDEDLKKLNESLQSYKMKSSLAGAAVMIFFFSKVGSWFEGRAVARLPFEPFSLFASVLNRGIQDDPSALSFMGCYILAGMIIRPLIPLFVKVGIPEFVKQPSLADLANGGAAAAVEEKKNQ